MPDFPLLTFQSPTEADRSNLHGGPGSTSLPSHQRQQTRLNPKFRALQDVMEARMANFQIDPTGIEPEEVLVFEIAGSVTSFLSVCNNTDGLEWMADFETEQFVEDQFFHRGDSAEEGKPLRGRLLLTMANQQGIENLLSMWENWQEDEDYNYERGLNGWKNIFPRIIDIRRWGVQERFEETGIIEDWEFELEHGKEEINFEVELWHRSTEELREQASNEVNRLIGELGGSVLQEVSIPEIHYHGLLGQLSSDRIEDIIGDHSVELIKCDQIMFFRPNGQAVPKRDIEEVDQINQIDRDLEEVEPGEPELALLDGLPIQNHFLLRDRLVIDDPDNFEDNYPVAQREHGTSMASIMIHGDLSQQTGDKLKKSIYVRPILKYDHTENRERVPRNRLFVELLKDAITRMFDPEHGEPTARNVKVINLSVGDSYRPFYYNLSSVARLLDWLSFKYNVLFLVSAGNNSHRDIAINTNGTNIEDLTAEEIQRNTLLALYKDQRNRTLIAPAESINSITVGASHQDYATLDLGRNQFNLIQNPNLPSPINPVGSGFKRSVKPEIIAPGGRVIHRFQNQSANTTTLRPIVFNRREPGIQVAFPGSTEGDLNAIAYTSGTSNATAMASNFAGNIIEVLREINDEANNEIPESYFPVLIKTLLGHTSNWGDLHQYIRQILDGTIPSSKIKDGISKLLGFGSLTRDRAYQCDVNRASTLGFGTLQRDEGHIFSLPLPPSLSGQIVTKRLIVTLGWFSPVNCGRQDYRKAHLYFDPPTDSLNFDRDETAAYTAKRGTLQHEILEGRGATPIVDGDQLNIKVSSRQDAAILNEEVPYGLCVTLETIDNTTIPIYEEVRERVAIPVEVRTQS